MNRKLSIFIIGFIFISIGLFHPILPSVQFQSQALLEITSPPHVISIPNSVAPLDVPFYTHDSNYLYLNPAGLCRFASREMIIAYWINSGYISGGVPSQYTLFVEEKHASYTETIHWESFTNRELFVVQYPFIHDLGFISYTNYVLTTTHTKSDDRVYFAKVFLSVGVPLFCGVGVNSEGWADEKISVPNHAIVLTGYDQNGFFYHNPISLDLSKPSCGANKFMTTTTFQKGMDSFWFFNAVFPVNYSPILTQITIKFTDWGEKPLSSVNVYSIWGQTKTNSDGYAQVTILKTGSPIKVDTIFPEDDKLYSGLTPFGLCMIYPGNTVTKWSDITMEWIPLTPHPWEHIPEKPTTPPPEPEYPYEPLPQPYVEPKLGYTPRLISSEFFIGGFLIVLSLIMKNKKHK